MKLDGKVAIVTGSTRGIGEDIACRFAREGARVIVTGRNAQRGEQVVERITGAGGQASYVRADVGQESDVRELVAAADERFGGLDILVNNAAATESIPTPIVELTSEAFDDIVKVSLYGTFWCCKYGIPLMLRAGGGSIINISSGAGVVGIPAVPAYSAAKSGVHGLSRNIAIDYGGHGIRSNTIVVGLIRDELTEALYAAPGMDKAVASLQMLPKQGVPEDITKLALYLASDDSSFVTAQEIRVDGGLTLKGGLQGNVVDLAFDDAADRARG